ncbi:TPA: ATPase [Escherichia coli]|nr:ATPase [Escherichia coli]
MPDQLHFVNTVLTARLLTAYGRRQLNKRAEAERIAKEQRIQADRMREENMTDEEWQKELQRREQVKAERRTYGEHLRSATHSAGRSRASMVADIESTDNWMDSL